MDQHSLAQITRITTICDALSLHPVYPTPVLSSSFDRLSAFDSEFWTFTHYLSRPLYEETSVLLQQEGLTIGAAPSIAVVTAVHRPDPDLLRLSMRSALEQIGVRVHLYLSLDGPEGNPALVEDVLADCDPERSQVTVLTHPVNRGVGLTRNAALAALQEEWFTFLDCDDIFHPLRLLHAWLAAQHYKVPFFNTAYSRVSLQQKKIVLLQQCLSSIGGNSFLAHRSILDSHGYLAPLRFWEDSEYQQRLKYFQLPMLSSKAIGHYQNTDLSASYQSLATRWRLEAYPIAGHPWLCGTTLGDIDDDTRLLRSHFQALYPRLKADQLAAMFPPEGAAAAMPPGPSPACVGIQPTRPGPALEGLQGP